MSKANLADTFDQLRLGAEPGDILIRIHTAIHTGEEAADLARFVKGLLPRAQIFGTSTSAVISWGRLLPDQCVISVTWMSSAHVRTFMLPFTDPQTGLSLEPERLCGDLRGAVGDSSPKLLLAFLTRRYPDVYRFVELCNDCLPGVPMAGGLADSYSSGVKKRSGVGFVFDENGWSDTSMIAAAISGDEVECMCSCATGAQVIGENITVTGALGPCALTFDGADAAQTYRLEVGDEITSDPELACLFPYVCCDSGMAPMMVRYLENTPLSAVVPADHPRATEQYAAHPELDPDQPRDLLLFGHNVSPGMKLRKAFIYDRKIIADNRALFRRVENFEKAETLFAYTSMALSLVYPNCVKWELSAYENSNMCGCVTDGEIACVDGRNCFTNCSFIVSVLGEAPYSQEYNPYALARTDTLANDNRRLLQYLMDIEQRLESIEDAAAAEQLRSFVRGCELMLLYTEGEDIPNAAAMYSDIKQKGIDRICIIDVTDITAIRTVFPDYLIRLTYNNYISKCVGFAKDRRYRVYALENWRVAISTPSYMTALSHFVSDMEKLQKDLFASSEEYISIVPIFCVIDDFTAEDLQTSYNTALMHMMQRNIQFYVHNTQYDKLDEDAIRDKYRMVNVINYALAHDKVIPHYQGIYDNKAGCIHHYESLMRLEDENGRMYYPGEFLDVARSFGLLYDSISKIMIRKVFRRFRGSTDCSVSVNLSMRDIRNRELTAFIYGFLSTAPHPENFVFEILENEDIDDYDMLVAFVYRIHSLGGRISIDDFGSGYSNLQHIASIQSDYIKIDGSIVSRLCKDPESEKLVALISGWKQLSSRKVKIIAEFVENDDIQHMLLDYDIDFSQGYLFSTPSPEITSFGVK